MRIEAVPKGIAFFVVREHNFCRADALYIGNLVVTLHNGLNLNDYEDKYHGYNSLHRC